MSRCQIVSYCVIRNFSIFRNAVSLVGMPTCELNSFLDAAYNQLGIQYPKFYKMDNLGKLGFLAAETVFANTTIADKRSVAVVLSNAHASLDTDVRYWQSTKTQPSPALFVYTLPNIVTGEICIRHGIIGENVFFVSERIDLDLLVQYAEMMFMQNEVQYCLAGWIDVMGDHHDVFLYLVEKNKLGNPMEDIRVKLKEIYQSDYGRVNG